MPFRQSGYTARYALLRNFKQVDPGGFSKVGLFFYVIPPWPTFLIGLVHTNAPFHQPPNKFRPPRPQSTILATHKSIHGPFPPLANKAILKPTQKSR